MKVITIVGARPQFIKSSIVSQKLKKRKIEEVYIHTGQHYDDNMSEIFFRELNIDKPKYNLHIGSGLHGEQTGRMIVDIEKVLLKEKPDGVLLYGDTNSTLAGAIVASKLHIPIFHVEGGIRTHDMTMPEEVNRILTDHVSSKIFSPTYLGMEKLEKEGLLEKSVNTGDVMLDRLLETMAKENVKNIIIEKEGLKENEYYVMTLHRPFNVDNKDRLMAILETVNNLDKKVVFSVHPRTVAKMKEFGLKENTYENIKFIEPLGYNKLMRLVQSSKVVLTDSGGLQKEACFLGKKSIIIYSHSIWKELDDSGWALVWRDLDKNELEKFIYSKNPDTNILEIFGSGKASDKICDEIYAFLKGV